MAKLYNNIYSLLSLYLTCFLNLPTQFNGNFFLEFSIAQENELLLKLNNITITQIIFHMSKPILFCNCHNFSMIIFNSVYGKRENTAPTKTLTISFANRTAFELIETE